MDKNQKLLILEDEDSTKGRQAFRMRRANAKNTLKDLGAKVRHDSGGRIMIIEISKEEEKALTKNFPNARILSIDQDMKPEITGLNPEESLFLNAVQKRMSPEYRAIKKRQVPGESPEEKKMFSGPCIREEY